MAHTGSARLSLLVEGPTRQGSFPADTLAMGLSPSLTVRQLPGLCHSDHDLVSEIEPSLHSSTRVAAFPSSCMDPYAAWGIISELAPSSALRSDSSPQSTFLIIATPGSEAFPTSDCPGEKSKRPCWTTEACCHLIPEHSPFLRSAPHRTST